MAISRITLLLTTIIIGAMLIFLYNNRALIYDIINPSPNIGSPAPNFTLIASNNTVVTLSQYKGKKVLLHFMATWCSDCKKELPEMQEFYNRNKSDPDLVILNVAFRENQIDTKEFLRKKGYSFPVYGDPDGETAHLYGIRGIPTSVVIDRKGSILRKIQGRKNFGGI